MHLKEDIQNFYAKHMWILRIYEIPGEMGRNDFPTIQQRARAFLQLQRDNKSQDKWADHQAEILTRNNNF